MTFRIKILRRAHADFLKIFEYIHERSPKGAEAWVSAFEEATARLESNANCCPEADENRRFDIDVKQSSFKTRRGRVYRLIFTIVGDEVRVLRVRGSGQAPIEPDD